MKPLLIILCIVGTLSTIVTYNIWYIPLFKGDENVIDRGWAIFAWCVTFALWKGSADKALSKCGKWMCWLACANLLDEFIFDPLNTNVGEYIFAIVVTLLTLHEWKIYQKGNFGQK